MTNPHAALDGVVTRLATSTLLVVSLACGSPTGPSTASQSTGSNVPFIPDLHNLPPSPLVLPQVEYWLQVWGLDRASPPEATCKSAGPRVETTLITTPVHVAPEGDGYRAVSTPGNGTLDMRFSATSRGGTSGQPLTGTIRGTARDVSAGPFRPASSVAVRILELSESSAGGAQVQGVGVSASTFLSGQMMGLFAFVDAANASSICQKLYWTLQPRT